MATNEIADRWADFPTAAVAPRNWRFLEIRHAIESETPEQKVLSTLRAGRKQAFKPWRLRPWECTLRLLPFVVAAVSAIWFFHAPISFAVSKALWPAVAVALVIATAALWRRYKHGGSFDQTVIGVMLCLLWPVFRLQLHVFDRVFLADGQLPKRR